jgi:hypothetical protein
MQKINCECSESWKRDFIQFTAIFAIAVFVVSFASGKIPIYLIIPFGLINIAYLFVAMTYILKLKEKKCECATGKLLNTFQIINFIQIGFFALGVILLTSYFSLKLSSKIN